MFYVYIYTYMLNTSTYFLYIRILLTDAFKLATMNTDFPQHHLKHFPHTPCKISQKSDYHDTLPHITTHYHEEQVCQAVNDTQPGVVETQPTGIEMLGIKPKTVAQHSKSQLTNSCTTQQKSANKLSHSAEVRQPTNCCTTHKCDSLQTVAQHSKNQPTNSCKTQQCVNIQTVAQHSKSQLTNCCTTQQCVSRQTVAQRSSATAYKQLHDVAVR